MQRVATCNRSWELAGSSALAGCIAACNHSAGTEPTQAWDTADDAGESAGDASSGQAPEPATTATTATTTPTTDAPGTSGAPADDGSEPTSTTAPPPSCEVATTPCDETTACCEGTVCGDTSLGQVCCGVEDTPCATPDGSDCCGALWCIDGVCAYGAEVPACESPCKQPPALLIEKQRLADLGGSFLGICGDENHLYGYHLPAAVLPGSDYSLEGALNEPACEWYASAIDIGMDWPASREWLMWFIQQVADDNIHDIAEVIGSYDGVDVRYWSDSTGWQTNGIEYTGSGHDTWTHVSVYRSTANEDHRILAGWTADGQAAAAPSPGEHASPDDE